jgi:hypothetical protein
MNRAFGEFAGETAVAEQTERKLSAFHGTECVFTGHFKMSFYPAVIVSVDATTAVVKIEATGKQIVFPHSAHNAVPVESRQVGAKGFISFPKVPPVFTAAAA